MATDLGKVGIVLKGTWSSSATYEIMDAVNYNDGTYIAKQAVPANTLPTNTTYWQAALKAPNPTRVTINMSTLDANLSGTMYIDKQNNVVSLTFYDLKGSAFSTIAGAIASDYRPSHITSGAAIKNDGSASALISITSAGNLKFEGFATNTLYTGTITYIM